MLKSGMRLLAAGIGVVLVGLLALGGMAAYRAIVRFREPLPPEDGLGRKAAPPPRQKVTPPPQVVEERAPCPIVPEPKFYKETGRTAELSPDAAIVLGAKATEPERYAAERLQGLLERRFRRRLPIRSEEGMEDSRQSADGSRQVILLGQRGTNSLLDRLCGEKEVDLSPESPGHDGFIIEVLEAAAPPTSNPQSAIRNPQCVVLIGGSNDRGVVYGQDAFSDLLRREGERVVFPVASVRDWPSILWRGRVHPVMVHYLEPGVLDAFVRARLNCFDLRNLPAKRGEFGFAPGEPLPKDDVAAVVAQAHRRGIFVYGTVSCSFGVKDPPKVERTFTELRELGVDGFVVDFNDLGAPKGSDELVRRILSLGERLGVRGRAVATVPPMGAYQHVKTEYSQAMAKVPGFDEATWFFTVVPGRQWAEAASQVGLKHPAWWHNWPRTEPGLLHQHYGGRSLRVGDKPAYLDPHPLSSGWGSPGYEELRDAPKYTDTVIYSGSWPEEVFAAIFGFWAWHPDKHDWERTCRAIRAYVFGPSHVAAAQRFDAALASLKPLFILAQPQVVPGYNWPPRLKRAEDRAEALRLLDEMDAALRELEASAPAETAIEPERLRTWFLEPMRATVACGRKVATYEPPGRAMLALEDKLLALLAEGEAAAAEQEFLRGRGPLLQLIEEAEGAVADLQMTKEWLAGLRGRLEQFAYWPAYAAERQAEIREAFARVYPKEAEPPEVPAILNKPPQGQALAELSPRGWLTRPIVGRGLWSAGVVAAVAAKSAADAGVSKDPKAVPEKDTRPRFDVLVLTHFFPASWQPMPPGEYVELRADMAAPRSEGPLTLQVPLAVASGGVPPDAVVAELWANGQRVLEQDVALALPAGDWLNIGVAGAAKGADRLRLRLRLSTRRASGRFQVAACLGSVRLVAGEPPEQGRRPPTLPTGGEE